MSNAAKAKGTRWETALAAFFRTAGIGAYRPAQAGFRDVGDLHGLDPFVGQAKDYKSWQDAIREGLDGAEKQKLHAGQLYGVAFIKRARRGAGAGYAVTTVATWARVLIRLRRAEELLRDHVPIAVYDAHIRQAEAEAGEAFGKELSP
ncbi:hypothetical protein GCM10010168_53070 [Actinoplanes ianthinogenes]|uniref:Holliday junction resolvase n=1 Tax=Actinoplanes ianthinogenes TaxID=122358 RepID=A0ABM7LR13_9ACTN|nr:hypothetical protein [Actinoplanes ianthinogenes]BCJ41695.1 hypothetical protein Aiant_23520 [Actinoplanes ianthinogenes]GGR28355.1 hypothetical protein GCM10010168_53070 [Actinoplanes ianthinogenes]